jgi:hypothetical protein
MLKFLKLILIILWILFTVICIVISIKLIIRIFLPNIKTFIFIFYGIVAFIIFNFIVPKRNLEFWNTFFHELDHIIFMLITFSSPQKFLVSPSMPEDGVNGYVIHNSSRNKIIQFAREHLVNLAPYFLSPLTLIFIAIYYLIIPSSPYIASLYISKTVLNGLLFFIGFTYIYHVKTSFSQAKSYQTDFSLGYKYGIIFIIMMQFIFF